MERFKKSLADKGLGFWAVAVKETGKFIGFTGINELPYRMPFSPRVEIAWRLVKPFLGRGFAVEGAAGCLDYAFGERALTEVVVMMPVLNLRSVKVMQRIGMVNTGRRFLHPALPSSGNLAERLPYKITLNQWRVKPG